MKSPLKYVAEIRQVQEVALHGSADLGYWSDRLRPQELDPVSDDNRAQLVLTAVAAKWMGIPFRELSIGVLARAPWNEGHEEGIYLAHAFNSSRLLAFCERTLFRTPYYHADIRLDTGFPPSITVASSKQKLLEVKMRGELVREPPHSAAEAWEGPIYLPSDPRRVASARRLFWAKLAGETETYPFVSEDTALFNPANTHPVLEWLVESGFAAERWSIRTDATHARSKTDSID